MSFRIEWNSALLDNICAVRLFSIAYCVKQSHIVQRRFKSCRLAPGAAFDSLGSERPNATAVRPCIRGA